MPKKIGWTCTICTKEKALSNGWFVSFPTAEPPCYAVYGWEDRLAEESGADHLCGLKCLTTAVDRHIHPSLQQKRDAAAQL